MTRHRDGKGVDGEYGPWISMLFDWEMDPDPAQRVQAAKSLMRMLSAALAVGRDIPQPLRTWLADCLRDAASAGNADAAFGLKPGAGRRAQYILHMHDAAQLHAIAQWHSKSQNAAAQDVAALPGRLDASNLVKHHSNALQYWSIAGPYVADPGGEPTENLATQADLAPGSEVVVVFTLKTVDVRRAVLRLPADLAHIAAPKSRK